MTPRQSRYICTFVALPGELQIWKVDDFPLAVSVKNGTSDTFEIVVRRQPKRRKKKIECK